MVVPEAIHGLLKIETAGMGYKPYYAVAAALANWTGLCSICSSRLPEDQTREEDYLMRCKACREAGILPDRTRTKNR